MPGVEAFPPDQTPGTDLQIGSRQNDRWAFATQFEGHRREIRGCSGEDLAADGSPAGEENVIEGHGHQVRCHGSVSLYHGHHIGFEMSWTGPGNQV